MSNQDLLTHLQSQVRPKTSGLGFVWSNTTGAVGNTFGAVNELAVAGRQLAVNAKNQALISRVESSQELLKALGVEATGAEALTMAQAVTDYLCNV